MVDALKTRQSISKAEIAFGDVYLAVIAQSQ